MTDLTCPVCDRRIPASSWFCLHCGASLPNLSEAPTRTSADGPASPVPQGTTAYQPVSDPRSRFLPGATVGGRYRIVGLLGRGGMGEVYRAEDLKLGHAVALKFLPEVVQSDRARLELFLNEARLGLRVSHPNVCRLYDLSEADGQHFISMEYVDGEDLAALLRRIGRLPGDKALQIARQLCAGLAAAHEQGVLHRDLKPANIMIDGRGRAKINDFGLAAIAGGTDQEGLLAGTPGYMAPEYIAGEAYTRRSDIYCLGLVLYEIFTGKRAFEGSSGTDLMERQRSSSPSDPSSHVDGLDRAVERTILRCLERDPSRRPASALSVAGALPGGDPLQAVLAAGETPDPQLLAEAGVSGGLSRAAAWGALLATMGGLVLGAFTGSRLQTPQRVPLPHPPEVLRAEAREVLRSLGHGEHRKDSAFLFEQDDAYLRRIRESDPTPDRWTRLADGRPALLRFWYHESPSALVPVDLLGTRYSREDPPLDEPGMAGVLLDPEGRLLGLRVVPPNLLAERSHAERGSIAPDWSALFEAAELDLAGFSRDSPRIRPPVATEQRVAWTGTPADGVELRVEAGTYGGQVVWFETFRPWQLPTPDGGRTAIPLGTARGVVFLVFRVLMVAIATLIAIRNLKAGRVDRRGAAIAALVVGLARFSVWVFGAHYSADAKLTSGLFANLAWSLWHASFVYVIYLAVEPYLRRVFPHRVVAWARLLQKRPLDPLVGREVLFGVAWGVGLFLVRCAYHLVPTWLGRPPPPPGAFVQSDTLLAALPGGRFFWHALGDSLFGAVHFVALGVMFLVLLRLLLKGALPAGLVFVGVVAVMANPGEGAIFADLSFAAAWAALGVLLLVRVGLLALTVGLFVERALLATPMTTDLSVWYSPSTLFVCLLLVALAVFGARRSLAGQPLIRHDRLSDGFSGLG